VGSDRNEQERLSGKPARKPRPLVTGKPRTLVAYNPTEQEKAIIRECDDSMSEVMTSLSSWCLEGHKLSLHYIAEYEVYAAMIRQGNIEWDKALAISHWHKYPEFALRGLDYALKTRFPAFPDGAYQSALIEADW